MEVDVEMCHIDMYSEAMAWNRSGGFWMMTRLRKSRLAGGGNENCGNESKVAISCILVVKYSVVDWARMEALISF